MQPLDGPASAGPSAFYRTLAAMLELRITLDPASLDAPVALSIAGGTQIAQGTIKAEDALKIAPAAIADAARVELNTQAAARLAELEQAASDANARAKAAKESKDAAAAAAAVWTTPVKATATAK